MSVKTFTKLCLLALAGMTLSSLNAQPTPFYQETFPSADAFASNWTTGGTNAGPEVWHWDNDPTGVFQGQPDFASTTASNGFIVFNSDDNGDVAHDVYATSKPINCTGKSTVYLRSENQYGYFSQGNVSIAEVGVSTNGTDFTYHQVLTNVANNDVSDDVQIVVVELPEAANQANVYIRFRWRGQYEYLWRIDDVALYDSNPTADNDLAVAQPRIPRDFATPVSQLDSIGFALEVQNNGLMPQTSVMAKVEVNGDNGDTFSATEDLGTVAPTEKDTFDFTDTFVPSGVGNYTFKYSVSQNETESSPVDNSTEGEFIVTDDLFSKDDGNIVSATQPNSVAGEFWEIGNYYSVINEGDEAYQASFSIASNGNSHIGKTATIFLYRVEDDGNSVFNDDDLTIVGFGSYEFTAVDTNFTLINADIFPIEGNGDVAGVKLTPGDYFLTVQLDPDMFMPISTLAYYYDFATVVKNGDWFLGGFGPDATALVRMRVRTSTTSTKEPQLADNQLALFPNPVQKTLNVKIELQDVTKHAKLSIMDATGRTVMVRNYQDFKDQTMTIDASKLAAGTYFMHLRTDEGVKTKRFVVQH